MGEIIDIKELDKAAKPPEKDPVKEAEAMLVKDQQERQQKAKDEIAAILKKYNATIVAEMLLRQNAIVPIISVLAVKNEKPAA